MCSAKMEYNLDYVLLLLEKIMLEMQWISNKVDSRDDLPWMQESNHPSNRSVLSIVCPTIQNDGIQLQRHLLQPPLPPASQSCLCAPHASNQPTQLFLTNNIFYLGNCWYHMTSCTPNPLWFLPLLRISVLLYIFVYLIISVTSGRESVLK